MRLRRSAVIIAAKATVLIIMPAGAVLAHAPVPGPRGAYAAFVHTLTEPPAILALLGLGLLIGTHGLDALKWAWSGFILAMIAGLTGFWAFGLVINPELPLLAVALAAGGLVAAALPLATWAAGGLGAIAGGFLGIFIAPIPASWSPI